MDPLTPGQAADSLWLAVDELRRHDALTSMEFGAGVQLDDREENAENIFASILSCHGGDSVACSSRSGRLEHQNRFLIIALEGRRLYDPVEAFMQSKRHTPLRLAWLAVLEAAAWIQPIRVQMLHRPALLKEIIATLQFYTDAEPGSKAANAYLRHSSISAVMTLGCLLCRGGGLKTRELAQLGDMGIVPAMASWSEALVSARNLQAIERPGPAGSNETNVQRDELGIVCEAGTICLAASSYILAKAAFTLGPGLSCWMGAAARSRPESPPDHQVAVVAALLKPLQGLLRDPGMAPGLSAGVRAGPARWYLIDGEGPDATLYTVNLCNSLNDIEFEVCMPYLPDQLKTDAAAVLDMLAGLGVWPDVDNIFSLGNLRVRLLGEAQARTWPKILQQREANNAAWIGRLRERFAEERAAQMCSRPGCTCRPKAEAGGRGGVVDFQQCARCKVATYCCKECQVKHWKSDHKKFLPPWPGREVTAAAAGKEELLGSPRAYSSPPAVYDIMVLVLPC